jgi:glycosyltransferase 2 family protein
MRKRKNLFGGRNREHVLLGAIGFLLGGVFLWLAMRNVNPADIKTTLRQVDIGWLIAGVTLYLLSIGVRCLRWGILLRATGSVKWRHAAEALVTGYAVNFVLPGRVGELFRADYAHRVFKLSRFTAFGTIIVERVYDGIVLVCALWISVVWVLVMRFAFAATSWIFTVGAVSTSLFGAALVFILLSRRIDLRKFGIGEAIVARWDRLVEGMSSVLRGNTATVTLCSIGVMALEALALASIVRCFAISLSIPETMMLLSLAALSTLVPTAPGFVGTYQLVFGHVFKIFGYPQTIGVIAATAIQIFFFGTVTIIGGLLLVSRSGIMVWRSNKLIHPDGS